MQTHIPLFHYRLRMTWYGNAMMTRFDFVDSACFLGIHVLIVHHVHTSIHRFNSHDLKCLVNTSSFRSCVSTVACGNHSHHVVLLLVIAHYQKDQRKGAQSMKWCMLSIVDGIDTAHFQINNTMSYPDIGYIGCICVYVAPFAWYLWLSSFEIGMSHVKQKEQAVPDEVMMVLGGHFDQALVPPLLSPDLIDILSNR